MPFRYARCDQCEKKRVQENNERNWGDRNAQQRGEINCAHSAISLPLPLSPIRERKKEIGDAARSLINSIARILRSYCVSRSRELYSNFSSFDQNTFTILTQIFLAMYFPKISKWIALQRRESSDKKMFSGQNICSFNAQYCRGFVNVGISYIFHQSRDARTFVRFRRQRSGGSYTLLSESPAL